VGIRRGIYVYIERKKKGKMKRKTEMVTIFMVVDLPLYVRTADETSDRDVESKATKTCEKARRSEHAETASRNLVRE
jgi:hypothetical protein